MITVILHFFAFFLSLVLFIGVYSSYLRGRSANKQLKDFSFFFLSFAGYQIFMSSYLFIKDLTIVSYSYNIAILFLFIVLAYALKLSLSLINFKHIKGVISFVFLAGIAIIFVQFYDFRLPILHESGFILWNANPWAAWATSIMSMFTASILAYVFLKNMYKADKIGMLKNALLIVMAVAFGLSGIFYFHPNYTLTVAAFVSHLFAFFAALLFVALPFAVEKHQNSFEEGENKSKIESSI